MDTYIAHAVRRYTCGTRRAQSARWYRAMAARLRSAALQADIGRSAIWLMHKEAERRSRQQQAPYVYEAGSIVEIPGGHGTVLSDSGCEIVLERFDGRIERLPSVQVLPWETETQR